LRRVTVEEITMQQSVLQAKGAATGPGADLVSIVNQCYQCGKCSAGCPVAGEMDLLPHQLVRLAVLGAVDRIMNSHSIWLCLACHTCGARCPNGIDVPALLDPIRHKLIAADAPSTEPSVPIFHKAFLKTVRMFGRVHELTLIGLYKMKTGTYFNDMKLGMNMFKKGRIHIMPRKSKRRSEVKDIFKRSSLG
jgi:heterodisulfide reductase subunit C